MERTTRKIYAFKVPGCSSSLLGSQNLTRLKLEHWTPKPSCHLSWIESLQSSLWLLANPGWRSCSGLILRISIHAFVSVFFPRKVLECKVAWQQIRCLVLGAVAHALEVTDCLIFLVDRHPPALFAVQTYNLFSQKCSFLTWELFSGKVPLVSAFC